MEINRMNFVLGKNKQNLKDDLGNSETYQIRKLNDTIPIFDEKKKGPREDLSQNDQSEPEYYRRRGVLEEDPLEKVVIKKKRDNRMMCVQIFWMIFLVLTIASIGYEIFFFTQIRSNFGT